ncbi:MULTISPECIES: hypothetical protein [Hyphomicrobiales]|jgi:hypothetical protein|uniref:hypothetical protein n=1 Tax=Methylobacterium sp. CCH7-A2 TaxID=1768789 RepID=UPI00082E4EA8|nr:MULTISPECIES: hypothetical protein [Hyphomicrobiales]
MTSAPVIRMDRAQRRRLIAALVADAIGKGQLGSDAIDFAALLFGDPDLWTDVGEHGAIVQRVLATSPKATTPTAARFAGKALPVAMKTVEDEIVLSLGIEGAQATGGGGRSGDDTEYRRIRSKLANYVRYLSERGDYEELNRKLRGAYAAIQADARSAEDLAKEFSLPLEDVENCRAEVGALIKIAAAPAQASLKPLVPTNNGRPRRGLLLLDTSGRLRWGRRRHGGAAPAPAKTDTQTVAVSSTPTTLVMAQAMELASREIDQNLIDSAILRARVGLEMNDEHRSALPARWEMADLGVFRIIELLPYPRPCHLDTALAAFGHPSQQVCMEADTAIVALLESQAAPLRTLLIERVNKAPPDRVLPGPIPDRWWRAVTYLADCRTYSGEHTAHPKWPEDWEYLGAAQPGVYTDEGRFCTILLDVILDVVALTSQLPERLWQSTFSALEQRGGDYVAVVRIARQAATQPELIDLLIGKWLTMWEGVPIEKLLPAFAD